MCACFLLITYLGPNNISKWEVIDHHFYFTDKKNQTNPQQKHPRLREVKVLAQSPPSRQWQSWAVNPEGVTQSPLSPSLALSKNPNIGETKGSGGGKWATLTFLVLSRALCEEQLVLSIWEVGWKKLTHEGAGRKDKAD